MVASKNVIETIMGGIVLLVAASFIYIAYQSGNIRAASGYTLYARFNHVGGLAPGSDVRVGGIKVGKVTEQHLDQQNGSYQAVLTLTIDNSVILPSDTFASVVGDGLLGNKYVSLEPGGSDEMLKPGAIITDTQSSINLETLIGKFIFNGASGGKDSNPPAENTNKEGTAVAPVPHTSEKMPPPHANNEGQQGARPVPQGHYIPYRQPEDNDDAPYGEEIPTPEAMPDTTGSGRL